MLASDDPEFADYDGEAEAIRQQFWRAAPEEVGRQLQSRTRRTREILSRVGEEDWARTGHRGDGKVFTVAGLCRFLLHDVEHHLHDVDG